MLNIGIGLFSLKLLNGIAQLFKLISKCRMSVQAPSVSVREGSSRHGELEGYVFWKNLVVTDSHAVCQTDCSRKRGLGQAGLTARMFLQVALNKCKKCCDYRVLAFSGCRPIVDHRDKRMTG